MMDSKLAALVFNTTMIRLHTFVPKRNASDSSLFTHTKMLIFLLFDGFYFYRMKRSAMSPDVDQHQKKYIWFGIYASLCNICIYAWRITSTHFAYTTAYLQPPDPWFRNYSEATEERYLVPVYRVSYMMTPIRKVLERVLRLRKSLTTSFQRCTDSYVSWSRRQHYRRLHSNFLHYLYRIFQFSFNSLHPRLPALTVGGLWAFVSVIILLFDGPHGDYKYKIVMPINLIFCQQLNYKSFWTFFQSLVHHDALQVRGTIYEVRRHDPKNPWPVKLELKTTNVAKSDIYNHDHTREPLGYTFYNDDEIKAKGKVYQFRDCLLPTNIYQACHLVRVMPSYDHLTYNCQAFVQNLFRRIVAHEFHSKRLTRQPRHRTLHGYQNQRSNALILLVVYFTLVEEQMLIYSLHLICMPILVLLRLNYYYKWSVFATCTWHGKPASNRVACTQLLTACVVLYMLDINLVAVLLNPRSTSTEEDMLATYHRMATEIECGLMSCILVMSMINLLVKVFNRDSHFDLVYPRLVRHNKMDFASEGKKVDVKYWKPNSNQPVKSYKVTNQGLIPVVDEEVAVTVDVNIMAHEASNDFGLDKIAASRIRREFAKN